MGGIKTNASGGRMLELETQLQQSIMLKEKIYNSGDSTVWGKPPYTLLKLGFIDGNDYKQVSENDKGIRYYLALKSFALKFCSSRGTGASYLYPRLRIRDSNANTLIDSIGIGPDSISPIVQVQKGQRAAFLCVTSSAATTYFHEGYWAYQILPYNLKEE